MSDAEVPGLAELLAVVAAKQRTIDHALDVQRKFVRLAVLEGATRADLDQAMTGGK